MYQNVLAGHSCSAYSHQKCPGRTFSIKWIVHDDRMYQKCPGRTFLLCLFVSKMSWQDIPVFPIFPSCFGRNNCIFLHFASNLARVEAARFARVVMRGRCTPVEKQYMKTKEIM